VIVLNAFAFLQDLSALSIILFCVGVLLLIVEMCHPGFGAPGVLGLVCLVADIFLTAKTFEQGLVMTGIVAVVVVILLIISVTLVSKGKLPRTLTLKESTDRESGYIGGESLEKYLGKEGRALTDLRPAGTAELGGERVDVLTRGEFVEAGTELEVVEVGGNRVVVKKKGE
jgi:membrane-bound ClpP family serine protease